MSTNPDDLFLDDDQDTDTGDSSDTGTTPENSTIKEIRAALRRSERARKQEATELEELRAFRQERQAQERVTQTEQLFKEAQLNPAHSKLFLALNPEAEPTLDAVKAFASENQLTTVTGDEVEAPSPGIEPVVTGQPPQTHKVSQEELMKIYRQDPARARQLWEKGQVEPVDVPWQTQPFDWQGTG